MIKIRLARGGRKKTPFIALLLQIQHLREIQNSLRNLKFQSLLDKNNENRLVLDKDKIEH